MDTPLPSIGRAATPEQREALASPLRLEVFGHFFPSEPLSARELAERMGRSASSVYYHLHRLVEVGLLREAGERPRGTRTETLYELVGSALRLEPDGSAGTRDAILRTMAAAFRMAERDLEAALPSVQRALDGSGDVSVLATRLHFRATPEVLEEVQKHLRAALEVIGGVGTDGPTGPEAGPHHSLTLALLPLRGRDSGELE